MAAAGVVLNAFPLGSAGGQGWSCSPGDMSQPEPWWLQMAQGSRGHPSPPAVDIIYFLSFFFLFPTSSPLATGELAQQGKRGQLPLLWGCAS